MNKYGGFFRTVTLFACIANDYCEIDSYDNFCSGYVRSVYALWRCMLCGRADDSIDLDAYRHWVCIG